MAGRLGGAVQRLYVAARRRVRAAVVSRPWLDQRLGRALVRVDVAIRRLGVLDRTTRAGLVEHDGLTLRYGPAQAGVATSLVTNGEYEPETVAEILARLRPGDGFADLGAHIGWITLLAARAVGPEGRVYAFEPTPETRAYLERNVAENGFSGRVRVEPYAVSDGPGRARFLVGDLSEANAVVAPPAAPDTASPNDAPPPGARIVEVDTIALDDYFRRLGWPPLRLVKMDIEGQELRALAGMTELVARNPGLTLVFEYHHAAMAQAGTDHAALFHRLRDLGLTRFTVLHRQPIPMDLPADLPHLERLATRANVNILAEAG